MLATWESALTPSGASPHRWWFEWIAWGSHKIAMALISRPSLENIRHLSERVRIRTTNVQGAQNVIHADGCVTDR